MVVVADVSNPSNARPNVLFAGRVANSAETNRVISDATVSGVRNPARPCTRPDVPSRTSPGPSSPSPLSRYSRSVAAESGAEPRFVTFTPPIATVGPAGQTSNLSMPASAGDPRTAGANAVSPPPPAPGPARTTPP